MLTEYTRAQRTLSSATRLVFCQVISPNLVIMSNVNIPIIDISGNQEQVAVDLVNAAVEHGFIYIKHTPSLDISPNAVEEAFGIVSLIFLAQASCYLINTYYLQSLGQYSTRP